MKIRTAIRVNGPITKYRAKRTDGYASKKEAKRGAELELLQRLGVIEGLIKQPVYGLIEKSAAGGVIRYIADFAYFDCEKKEMVVEDVKGFKTPAYRLKKRIMWEKYGIRIAEI